jgi:hypothetical protein
MHAASQIEHEQATIKAFVSRDKQERFLTFLLKPKDPEETHSGTGVFHVV